MKYGKTVYRKIWISRKNEKQKKKKQGAYCKRRQSVAAAAAAAAANRRYVAKAQWQSTIEKKREKDSVERRIKQRANTKLYLFTRFE